ncbi:universal stress protein [Saccharothrix sp. HUAS TT1]|uniref:universal stress protein n=1 Tax=unclassified Saccharothrix TaxID=2593673 RepID=UPI00345BE2EB
MSNRALPAPQPVVTVRDGSAWGEAALRWAEAHASLVGAPLEVHEPSPDQVHDLLLASTRADVVVIGHRADDGRSFGLARIVLPLVQHAASDVVVVRGTPEALHGAHGRVTALITGDEHDEPALTRAIDLAARHGAALRVLHAAPPLTVRADNPGVLIAHVDQALRGVRHTSVLARMHPNEAIARYADTDLLVLGDRGPTARTALHHARCPVLVAHRVPEELRRHGVRRPERGSARTT